MLCILVPPKIDQPGRVDRPETVIDSSHSLTCPASGIPLPEITWYKSNQPIKENTTEYLLLNDGWTLKILSVTEQDSARFTCRAKNIVGQSEKAFDLNVLGKKIRSSKFYCFRHYNAYCLL